MSRPAKIPYTKKLAKKICVEVSNGSNLNRLGLKKTFPPKNTMETWRLLHPEFNVQYERAREERADWRANQMDQDIQDLKKGDLDWQTARLSIDNHKWQAGKEKPTYYGDRVQQDVNLSGNVTVDNLDKGRIRAAKREKPEE